ncbi:MAG: ABC-F family ATP-binding cassette domain-containing protein [Acidobacteriota bacterium]|nr:ABC-F family ATP-binding cassette domain-containing protein [Acidobacteriota bacterium]
MLFRLSEVYKSYSAHEILRGVSFQINPNEKVGLVGRNGAGKTTVFRLITGAETADAGEIVKINNLKLGLLEQHVDFTESETVHTAALSAFQRLHDIEAEMRRLEIRMAENPADDILERYADLQSEFEREDGFTYTAKAESILLGLGFAKETWALETRKLSGGQKNRLGLARLLLSQPDVLLLDEPTNHLDVNAVEWLENFLQTYEKTFVLISHDRYFLDRVTNRIIEIENGKAISYKGNYSDFLIEREERREAQRRAFENQQALIAKNEEFIRRNIAGQKTKMAKSRRNMLERLERVEAAAADKSSGNFQLKKVERAGNQVLTVEKLSIGYGEKVLARNIDFSLLRGEALGVIGGNGTGKTTFLKTILGNQRELSGKILWGAKVDTGYYSQNLEDLEERNEIIQELRRVAPLAENGELRSFLARFLFTGEDIFKQVRDLSGGEKGRLALAKLIYSNKNVLVLDEPTNHLDIPSREALEAALDAYQGTIITVSHDRYFLDRIATQILSFETDKTVEIFKGNYSEFHEWKKSAQPSAVSRQPEVRESQTVSVEQNNQDQKAGSAAKTKDQLSKNQRQRIESRIKEIEESLIPAAEERLAQLSFQMSQPDVAANHARLQEVTQKFAATEAEIQNLYEEWEHLSEEIQD